MTKICPATGSPVLYLDCLECDDKSCEDITYITDSKVIQNKLENNLNALKKIYYYNEIVFMGVYGDQNYDLDTQNSDVNSKTIILPTIKELYTNHSSFSSEIPMTFGRSDVKDVNTYISMLRKQSIGYIEPLFSDYQCISEDYKNEIMDLLSIREDIARYNPHKLVLCAVEHASTYLKEFNGQNNLVSASGILRLNNLLSAFDKDYSFKDCLKNFDIYDKETISGVRIGDFSLSDVNKMMIDALTNMTAISNKYNGEDYYSNNTTRNRIYDVAYNLFEKQHKFCTERANENA